MIYLAQKKRHPRTGLVRWVARGCLADLMLAVGVGEGDIVRVDAACGYHAEEKLNNEKGGGDETGND